LGIKNQQNLKNENGVGYNVIVSVLLSKSRILRKKESLRTQLKGRKGGGQGGRKEERVRGRGERRKEEKKG
jgi:hypothetical protein